jgi:hypothetical protein
MRGNRNAAKDGYARLVAIRVGSKWDYRLIVEALGPEQRGAALVAAARAAWDAAMTIVADCDRCGEAITESEGIAVVAGENLCVSCAALAALVEEIKNAPGGAATPPARDDG